MIRTGVLITIFCFLSTSIVLAAETSKQREQKEAYQKQLELRLAEVNQKLGTLSSKTSAVREESRKEFTQQMEDAGKKREAANKKMAELRSASGSDWERLKAETNAAIDDLNRVYDRMRSLFKT